MSSPEKTRFLKENSDAEKCFEKYCKLDPFPNIPPALLNSADIYDYILATGMICPFDESKLKSASYEVGFLGDLHMVDELGNYNVIPVENGNQYYLPSNSISFLFLETTFRLPDYIAARFNLHISLVHAGLLLGTGPLIDPGFAGQLLIPLHNLTSEKVSLKGGKGLIWVEFTKLSPNRVWDSNYHKVQKGVYKPFPESKRYQVAEKYFRKAAYPGTTYPAKSSIPIEISKSAESARKASKSATEIRSWFRVLSGIGLLGIFGLGFSVYSLIHEANNNIDLAYRAISDYRDYQNEIMRRLDTLDEQVDTLQANQSRINEQISALHTLVAQKKGRSGH
jgi:deoxycytidine triphosphate deaminase